MEIVAVSYLGKTCTGVIAAAVLLTLDNSRRFTTASRDRTLHGVDNQLQLLVHRLEIVSGSPDHDARSVRTHRVEKKNAWSLEQRPCNQTGCGGSTNSSGTTHGFHKSHPHVVHTYLGGETNLMANMSQTSPWSHAAREALQQPSLLTKQSWLYRGKRRHRRIGKAKRWRSESFLNVQVRKNEGDSPVLVSTPEKVWMQIGWILEFWLMVLAVAFYGAINEIFRTPMIKQTALDCSHESDGSMLYRLLWGQNIGGQIVSISIVTLSVFNFYTFSMMTEVLSTGSDYSFFGFALFGMDALKANQVVELVSLVFFTVISLARLVAINYHPDWKHFGYLASIRYIFGNVFMSIEVFALCLSYRGLYLFLADNSDDHLNFLWLFLGRSLEMLSRSGLGTGTRQLAEIVDRDGKLIGVACIFGLVLWFVMSGLYWVSNRKNPESVYKWVQHHDGKEWVPWQRFESIPSSMWYVLINLVGEHPLADAHTTFFQRLWVCCMCIFATPIFALPTSLLQNALLRSSQDENNDGEPQGEEEKEQEASLNADISDDQGGTTNTLQVFLNALVTGIISFTPIIVYFYFTAAGTDHSTVFLIQVTVSPLCLAIVDGTASVCFACEMVLRIVRERTTYCMHLAVIDLLAWLPGLIHVSWYFISGGTAPPVVCSLVVLRVFKLERYLHSLSDVCRVVSSQRAILAATLLVSSLLWVFFSLVLYQTERGNPEPDMRETYGSMMGSLWAELINLHGEYPWPDYTTLGKAICSVIAIFSIMLFCIPISIFGDGFAELVAEEGTVDNTDVDRRPWQERCRPEREGLRQKVYDVLYGHLHTDFRNLPSSHHFVRLLVTSMVLINVCETLVETVPPSEWGTWAKLVSDGGFYIDIVSVAIFGPEFLVRCFATGGLHTLSLVGVCDVLSLLAIAVNLHPAYRAKCFLPPTREDPFDDIMVPFRLLRLFSLESYLCSVHTMINVLWLNRLKLLRSGYVLVVFWFIHATMLFLAEHCVEEPHSSLSQRHAHIQQGAGEKEESENEEEDEVNMCQRYASVLRSLQYSIVHLFGDFPETDYTLTSKVVHFIGIIAGMAMIGSFTSVFSTGFVEYLQEKRSQALGSLVQRKLMVATKLAKLIQRRYRQRSQPAVRQPRLPSSQSGVQQLAMNVIYRRTFFGICLMNLFHSVLLLNLMKTLVASLPELNQAKNQNLDFCLVVVEVVCSSIFILELVLRLIARPHANLAWRIFDSVCILPGIGLVVIEQTQNKEGGTWECICEALCIFRAVRILDFEHIKREVVMIHRSLANAGPMLAVPGFMALNIWISTSSLFMWLEQYYKEEGGQAESMTSVPAAMYWCCIFLTGEWANVDFTYAGSRLSIFYVIIGVAMFSIPVGIIVEAVQSTIEVVAHEEANIKALMEIVGRRRSRYRRSLHQACKQETGDVMPLEANVDWTQWAPSADWTQWGPNAAWTQWDPNADLTQWDPSADSTQLGVNDQECRDDKTTVPTDEARLDSSFQPRQQEAFGGGNKDTQERTSLQNVEDATYASAALSMADVSDEGNTDHVYAGIANLQHDQADEIAITGGTDRPAPEMHSAQQRSGSLVSPPVSSGTS